MSTPDLQIIEEIKRICMANWGWVIFIAGTLIQVSPVKVYPLNWVKALLKWIGKQMTIDLESSIESLKKDVKRLEEQSNRIETENDERRIKDLRSEILNFAEAIRRPDSDNDREQYEHVIFDLHKEYEELLSRYGRQNGKVDKAMGRITTKYEALLKNPEF